MISTSAWSDSFNDKAWRWIYTHLSIHCIVCNFYCYDGNSKLQCMCTARQREHRVACIDLWCHSGPLSRIFREKLQDACRYICYHINVLYTYHHHIFAFQNLLTELAQLAGHDCSSLVSLSEEDQCSWDFWNSISANLGCKSTSQLGQLSASIDCVHQSYASHYTQFQENSWPRWLHHSFFPWYASEILVISVFTSCGNSLNLCSLDNSGFWEGKSCSKCLLLFSISFCSLDILSSSDAWYVTANRASRHISSVAIVLGANFIWLSLWDFNRLITLVRCESSTNKWKSRLRFSPWTQIPNSGE